MQNGYNVLIEYFINSKQPLGQVLEKQGGISSPALLELGVTRDYVLEEKSVGWWGRKGRQLPSCGQGRLP